MLYMYTTFPFFHPIFVAGSPQVSPLSWVTHLRQAIQRTFFLRNGCDTPIHIYNAYMYTWVVNIYIYIMIYIISTKNAYGIYNIIYNK